MTTQSVNPINQGTRAGVMLGAMAADWSLRCGTLLQMQYWRNARRPMEAAMAILGRDRSSQPLDYWLRGVDWWRDAAVDQIQVWVLSGDEAVWWRRQWHESVFGGGPTLPGDLTWSASRWNEQDDNATLEENIELTQAITQKAMNDAVGAAQNFMNDTVDNTQTLMNDAVEVAQNIVDRAMDANQDRVNDIAEVTPNLSNQPVEPDPTLVNDAVEVTQNIVNQALDAPENVFEDAVQANLDALNDININTVSEPSPPSYSDASDGGVAESDPALTPIDMSNRQVGTSEQVGVNPVVDPYNAPQTQTFQNDPNSNF